MKPHAISIVRTLREAGFQAYFVGGCVRDLILGCEPADYDVSTNATPQQVMSIFPETYAVGAQFGVVLVPHPQGGRDDSRVVEVATFRSDLAYTDGRHPEGVQFESSPQADALRRDFTINALFRDPFSGEVHDFTGGRADLSAQLIRTVGDPERRFAEDHLRLLRAVRFAARLGFSIEPATMRAMQWLAPTIQQVSAERDRKSVV